MFGASRFPCQWLKYLYRYSNNLPSTPEYPLNNVFRNFGFYLLHHSGLIEDRAEITLNALIYYLPSHLFNLYIAFPSMKGCITLSTLIMVSILTCLPALQSAAMSSLRRLMRVLVVPPVLGSAVSHDHGPRFHSRIRGSVHLRKAHNVGASLCN